MSFEGYYQILCEDGHYDDVDCYTCEPEDWKCPECKKKVAWWNLVDVTNGSWEDDKRIDGHVELEVKSEHHCECSKCGNKHLSRPSEYKIPEKLGHKIK